MKLKMMIPERVLIEQEATRVVVRAENGYFCLLPHHVDFVSILVPGILTFQSPEGDLRHAAIGEGTLVKCGSEVLVSTRHATPGDDLDKLRRIVVDNYMAPDEPEGRALAAAADWQSRFLPMYLKAKER